MRLLIKIVLGLILIVISNVLFYYFADLLGMIDSIKKTHGFAFYIKAPLFTLIYLAFMAGFAKILILLGMGWIFE